MSETMKNLYAQVADLSITVSQLTEENYQLKIKIEHYEGVEESTEEIEFERAAFLKGRPEIVETDPVVDEIIHSEREV
jgi:regulator of replication initiation timing